MDKLVLVKSENLVTTTTAIAEGTGSDHASVIKLVRTHASDLEEFGTFGFEIQKSGGRPTEYALLNEQQATLIMSYMRNTEVIRKFKVRLVKTFYEMANELRKQSQQISIPNNLPEALRLAADLAEKNAKLSEAAEKARPKIDFHDAVKSCPDTMEIGRFAKILGTGRNRLFAWLRDNKYLMANNLPYQPYIDSGLFRVVERTITVGDEDKLRSTTYITGKGQTVVHKKMGKQGGRMKGYLNIKEVADFLRVSESTVERWQRQGVLPPFYQITPRSERFWNPKELESMIKNSRRAA